MDLLKPYVPSSRRPWDRAAAAHLLRRAGFAPCEREVRAALADGLGATVDRLVDGRADSARHDELNSLGEALAARGEQVEPLRGWWLQRMCHTARPLHARMAVFWHNHFATSNTKVASPPMMLQQLRAFERFGMGRFEELLLAISRDPAMIVWLDGVQNVKGRPNENYARELFELFALGVGHYTEADIREAARAFTGWHQRGGQYYFAAMDHDGGPKKLFGTTGPLDGGDIVRLTLKQPACARFLAGKLLREFVSPDPPDELVETVAIRLRACDYDLGETLRALLGSEAFFDPRWYRARIKSPVEYAVGLVRSLEMKAPANFLADAVGQMGQRLFEPPSVKGWDGHRAWINSATMLIRLNSAVAATQGPAQADVSALATAYGLDEPKAVEFCEQLTLDGRVPRDLHARVEELSGGVEARMRQALRLLLGSPEYQMC